MALRHSRVCNLTPVQLVASLADNPRKVKIIDCRSFLEYNDNHIVGAVNICCSKLIKRRLQQEKLSLKDLLLHCRIETDDACDLVVYDQKSQSADDVSPDSFIHTLLKKLVLVFEKVFLLSGGFVDFQALYPEFTENKVWKYPGLTALSQPCLPITTIGPTRILPFLYLGSEEDANNKELLQSHNITYELNVSNKCPKPEFISDGHFMRIPVNDSHNEKLLPYFCDAFQFVDKARESNESVLIHCLAGISRSPTVAIAYVMRYLQMTCEDAYRYVKGKRATISPNFNFLGQLLEYEKELVQDKVIDEKKRSAREASSFSPSSSTLDFVTSPSESGVSLPPQPPLIPACPPPPGLRPRLNLSLRFTPASESTSTSSPKDASPTTAMARLQFDKVGKENQQSSFPSRPTRLVKNSASSVISIQEEEVGAWSSSSSKYSSSSISVSISRQQGGPSTSTTSSSSFKSFKQGEASTPKFPLPPARGGFELFDFPGKKFKVHKIHVEGEDEPSPIFPIPSSSASFLQESLPVEEGVGADQGGEISMQTGPPPVGLSPVTCYKRGFSRSDSVSTSGIGSEISENELLASGSWEASESNFGDDGVFSSESFSSLSASRSPRRQLQLWSSDSGHWSSTDEGVSVSSSQVMDKEGPQMSMSLSYSSSKSPEKRKCPSTLSFPQTLSFHDKRRSLAATREGGDVQSSSCLDDDEEEGRRPKRWSIAEDSNTDHRSRDGDEEDDEAREGLSRRRRDNYTFDSHWYSMISGNECCERTGGRGGLLYRVHSCPGFLGYCADGRDPLHGQEQSCSSPPSFDNEPISDSVLLKIKKCCGRRGGVFDTKNRFSFGDVDYDQLLSKLKNIQDHSSKRTTTESSHSSSSTLASSSFSIVVQ